MNKLRIICSVLLISLAIAAQSQTSNDIYRLSNLHLIGTARSMGTNTQLNAIGADYTNASGNPAGLAQFSFSDFMISAGLGFKNISSTLSPVGGQNQEADELSVRFHVPTIGLVFASPRENGEQNKFVFGIGYNAYQTSQGNFNFSGESKGSITQRFAALANGLNKDQLDNYEAGLAYDTYLLIDQNTDGSWSYDYQGYESVALKKYQSVSSKTKYSEINISGALKSGKMLMVGASIGIPVSKYNENKVYTETDAGDKVPGFDGLQFSEHKVVSGAGVNGKLGVIFRPVNPLSVGLAFHSPSIIVQSEDFSTGLVFDYTTKDGPFTGKKDSPEGTVDYTYYTPMKLIGSLGSILGKNGFINAEISWSDLSKGRVSVKSNDQGDKALEKQINDEVKHNYTNAIKVNIGGELVLGKYFRIRAGYGMEQNGLKSDTKFYPSYAARLGYRKNRFYMDAAYRFSKDVNTYAPYQISGNVSQTLVEQKMNNSMFIVTVGTKLF